MRTDGDTWDIVSSVGLTALGVAAARAVETARPDAVIRDDYAELFVRAADDPRFVRMLSEIGTAERALFTGFVGARTQFFDDFFLTAAGQGARQAVILAAGLDARAYRLDWPAGTTVFEIDQPKVLEFKQTVLDEHGAQPKARRRTVTADLREDWPAALAAAGFDPARPTAWSAEGLLRYLPGPAQDAMLRRVDVLCAPGSSLAANCPTGDPADNRRLRKAMAARFDRNLFGGLDFESLVYDDDQRSDPAQLLADLGWTVSTVTPGALMADRDPSVLPAELAALRDRSMTFLTACNPIV